MISADKLDDHAMYLALVNESYRKRQKFHDEKSITMRKLSWFSRIFRKPRKFSTFALLKVGTMKNFEIFHSSGEESRGFLPRFLPRDY